MQPTDSNWQTTTWQALQRAGVVLQLLGLIVSLGLLWPLCHAHRLAIPAFGYLNVRSRQVRDRLRSLNTKNHSRS